MILKCQKTLSSLSLDLIPFIQNKPASQAAEIQKNPQKKNKIKNTETCVTFVFSDIQLHEVTPGHEGLQPEGDGCGPSGSER